jgi:hypothetical protein
MPPPQARNKKMLVTFNKEGWPKTLLRLKRAALVIVKNAQESPKVGLPVKKLEVCPNARL